MTQPLEINIEPKWLHRDFSENLGRELPEVAQESVHRELPESLPNELPEAFPQGAPMDTLRIPRELPEVAP